MNIEKLIDDKTPFLVKLRPEAVKYLYTYSDGSSHIDQVTYLIGKVGTLQRNWENWDCFDFVEVDPITFQVTESPHPTRIVSLISTKAVELLDIKYTRMYNQYYREQNMYFNYMMNWHVDPIDN